MDILKLLSFTAEKKTALTIIEPFIYGFKSEEIIPIIKQIMMSGDKLDMLRLLVLDILDPTEENK